MSGRAAPFRSVLLAPGNRADVCAKLPRSRPDAAVLDLEDGVPPGARVDARATVRSSVEQLADAHPEITWFVRVNAVATEWFLDDVRDALPPVIDGIVLPKVGAARDVVLAARALEAAGLGHAGILTGIETAQGVHDVSDILGVPEVVGAYFGAEDFIADMRGVRTPGGIEVLYARSRIALAARVAQVPAIDQVVVAFRDDQAYLDDARLGRSIGYAGKLCIHPAQVGLAHEVFSPSPEVLARARALVAAYDAALREGAAVIEFEGRMIDEALVREARVLVSAEEDGAPS